ncbi:MAG: phosphotransferase, partial [Pseudomonadota bacterium]
GEALARLHTLAADFKLTRTNSLGPDAWAPFFRPLSERADDVAPGLKADITAELDWLCNNRPSALPAGIIHADLFPDNVFFLNGRLAGVIDFYFACHDALVFDLAVAVNAWCFDADDRFIEERCTALLEGYEAVRPLDPREHAALAFYCRGTALRFLLTRLHDWIHHVPGSLVAPKDPRQFLARLHHHRQTPFS